MVPTAHLIQLAMVLHFFRESRLKMRLAIVCRSVVCMSVYSSLYLVSKTVSFNFSAVVLEVSRFTLDVELSLQVFAW